MDLGFPLSALSANRCPRSYFEVILRRTVKIGQRKPKTKAGRVLFCKGLAYEPLTGQEKVVNGQPKVVNGQPKVLNGQPKGA